MSTGYFRDFWGYGPTPPRVQWPGNARVVISFVVNLEEWAELAISAGDERNESVYEIVLETQGVPDLSVESHFEYGARVGFWRVLDLFDRYNVKATMNVCGRAVEISPWMAHYNFDTNDMRFTGAETFRLANDFATYLIDSFDWLYQEGERCPRMMTVGLHPRIIGRPGRIWALQRFLEHIR
jgi:peptidoglycan/xylan/chitin deacetylase (PgdA/CDA1 family)